MTLHLIRRLAASGCLAFFLCISLAGCGESSATSGGAGGAGGGGAGGMGGAECGAEATGTCLDLLSCCREILVNPVFFQSCNSVVLLCDQARCAEVLSGYPLCVALMGGGGAGGDGGAGGGGSGG